MDCWACRALEGLNNCFHDCNCKENWLLSLQSFEGLRSLICWLQLWIEMGSWASKALGASNRCFHDCNRKEKMTGEPPELWRSQIADLVTTTLNLEASNCCFHNCNCEKKWTVERPELWRPQIADLAIAIVNRNGLLSFQGSGGFKSLLSWLQLWRGMDCWASRALKALDRWFVNYNSE